MIRPPRALLFVGLLVGLPVNTFAQANCPQASGTTANLMFVSVIIPSSHPAAVQAGIQSGMDQWNDCMKNPTTPRNWWDLPTFAPYSGLDATLDVAFVAGVSNVSQCAFISWQSDGDGTIVLYEAVGTSSQNAQPCNTTAEAVSDNIAHELGHYLGLDDGCSDDIMGPATHNADGSFDTGRSVTHGECALGDIINTNPEEEFQEDCGGSQNCGSQGGQSPILVDLERDGFALTDLATGVTFDIDGDHEDEAVSWTQAGTLDAFVFRDRNGNGLIDGGRELFGDVTPSLFDGTPYAHGYLALAEYDLSILGGNQNGRIDPGDAYYPRLGLWADWNHDGVAGVGERVSLEESGVLSIELSFRESRRVDAHGNEFRYASRAWLRWGQQAVPIRTVDVFLLVGD